MRKLLFVFSISIILYACASKVVPLKNEYTTGNFEELSSKSKEKVWDNIVDFFSKNGLSIKIIDKGSGLIISDQSRLKWSFENPKGELYEPSAWVAVPRFVVGGTSVAPSTVIGEWNVRVKDANGGKTSIAVNLVNIRYNTIGQPAYTQFGNTNAKSTGVFERMIYDQVK